MPTVSRAVPRVATALIALTFAAGCSAPADPARDGAPPDTAAVMDAGADSVAAPDGSVLDAPGTTDARGPDGGMSSAPDVVRDPCHGGVVFHEAFAWRGSHAATVSTGGHTGTTVWWNPDDWDVRGDSDFLATDVIPDHLTTGFYVDVHRAASAAGTDPRLDDTRAVVGGDGSPGVGVMHLDEQDIVSARLRNPMLISACAPGVVSFYATRFVTTGHWWEVSITPAERVVGAEMSAVPGDADNCFSALGNCNDGLAGPTGSPDDGNAGPGHRPAEESINVIATGYSDIPACPDSNLGYHIRFGVKAQIGAGRTVDTVNPTPMDSLPVITPDDAATLYAYRIEYRPDGIDLYADFARDGRFAYHEHFARPIPWSAVYVHLLGIAYQADHHPQLGCGWQGTARDLAWRDISVGPLRYARTSVAPRDGTSDGLARRTGWTAFDLRDVARFGPSVGGAPQPNASAYSQLGSYAYTSFDTDVAGAPAPVSHVDLAVDLSADQVAAEAVRLAYDTKGTGTATLTVNGHALGVMQGASSVVGAATPGRTPEGSDYMFIWVRRGVDVPAALLHAGSNTVHIDFSGRVQLDRLQLEFGHP